ncbi:hypothetical protein ACFQ4K_11260 [Tistrella bauzanensis]
MLETSHLASGITGLLLLVIARGLSRRVDAAWAAAVVLTVAGSVLSLLKGWDWEEACLLALVAGLLVLARPAFHRHGSLLRQPMTPGWVAAVAIAVLGSTWLMWFSFRGGALMAEGAALGTGLSDALWTVGLDAEASRALRAIVAVVVLGWCCWPPGSSRRHCPGRARRMRPNWSRRRGFPHSRHPAWRSWPSLATRASSSRNAATRS